MVSKQPCGCLNQIIETKIIASKKLIVPFHKLALVEELLVLLVLCVSFTLFNLQGARRLAAGLLVYHKVPCLSRSFLKTFQFLSLFSTSVRFARTYLVYYNRSVLSSTFFNFSEFFFRLS